MNASKQRFGAQELSDVFDKVESVTVARGKKVLTFDMSETRATDADFLKVVLGPSKNLRAPTILLAKRAWVGFSEEAWATVFE